MSANTHTERQMLDALNVRYDKTVTMGTHWSGRRYARAEHVPTGLSGQRMAIADYIATDMRSSSGPVVPGKGNEWWFNAPVFHGHEVKVSRSDWLAELKNPGKSEWFRQHMHFWWLVVSDKTIVRDDLPDGWGLMVLSGRSVRIVAKAPPNLDVTPLPVGMVGALLRASTRTERTLTAAADTEAKA